MKKTFKCMSIFLTLMLLLCGCGAAGDTQNNAAETEQTSEAASVQDIPLDTEESDEVANVDSGIDADGETADSESSEAADIEETGSGENEENTEMNVQRFWWHIFQQQEQQSGWREPLLRNRWRFV